MVKVFGLQQCASDHFVFFPHCQRKILLVFFYLDNIIITGDDAKGTDDIRTFIQWRFHTKNHGNMLIWVLAMS